MDNLFGDAEEELVEGLEAEVDEAAPPEAAEADPRANAELLGHEKIEKFLRDDIRAGRLPHALILAGPPGIGKATLAFRLAKFLFAAAPKEGLGESLAVPPTHPAFRRVVSGGHADLMVIEREFDEKRGRYKNDISVDAVRRIHPFLRMTAAEGGWRVVIVDGAEYLGTAGQNALLKILEEPPKQTLLMLVTSQPGSFLPTIRSRCRLVTVEPLPEKTVGALLDKFAPGAEKQTLARLAEGSIGKALRFHEEGGVALYKELLKTAEALPQLDMPAVHALAEKLGKFGSEQSYETAMEIIIGWCARLARAGARGAGLEDVVSGDAAIFRRIEGAYPPGHFLSAWEKISALARQTERYNLDKKQAVIGAFLALQRPDYQGLSL